MTGYVDYENLNQELQKRIDALTPIKVNEDDFVNIEVPVSGLFIVQPSEGYDYLPTRDAYSVLSVVDEIGDNYIRTSLAGRITLEDVSLTTSAFMAHRIFPKVNGRVMSIAQERTRALALTEINDEGLPINPDIPYNTWIPLNNEYRLINDLEHNDVERDDAVLSAKVGMEIMRALQSLGTLDENGKFTPNEITINDITNLQNILDSKVNLQWGEF